MYYQRYVNDRNSSFNDYSDKGFQAVSSKQFPPKTNPSNTVYDSSLRRATKKPSEKIIDFLDDFETTSKINNTKYIYGTPVSKLNTGKIEDIFKGLFWQESQFASNPKYLEPWTGRLVLKMIDSFDGGLFINFVMFLMIGIIIACGWFFLMQIENVRKEITSHNFSQAFYALIILIAIIVGIRYRRSLSNTQEISNRYHQVLKHITILSTTSSRYFQEQAKNEFVDHDFLTEAAFQTYIYLQTLTYHCYTCMNKKGFVLDHTYFDYHIFIGEGLLTIEDNQYREDPNFDIKLQRYHLTPPTYNVADEFISQLKNGAVAASIFDEADFLLNCNKPNFTSFNVNPDNLLSTVSLVPIDPSFSRFKGRCFKIEVMNDNSGSKVTFGKLNAERCVNYNADASVEEPKKLAQSRKNILATLQECYSNLDLFIIDQRLKPINPWLNNQQKKLSYSQLSPTIVEPTNTPLNQLVNGLSVKNHPHFRYSFGCLKQLVSWLSASSSVLFQPHQSRSLNDSVNLVYEELYNIWIAENNPQPKVFNTVFTIIIYLYLIIMVPLQIIGNTNEYWGLVIIPSVFLIYMIPIVAAEWYGNPFDINRERDHIPSRQYRTGTCALIKSDFANLATKWNLSHK